MKRPSVKIYTDGAHSGDHGGWGASLYYGDNNLHMAGYQGDTTNNRMELQAIISALSTLTVPCTVHLYSDSKYALDGLSKYLKGWRNRGWMTATGRPVANQDLWELLFEYSQIHVIRPYWVRGHNGDIGNEIADSLAQMARRSPSLFD